MCRVWSWTAVCLSIVVVSDVWAQDSYAPTGTAPVPVEFSRWSGDLNVPDPVAISFDHQGRAYVTQTQRRKSQDLDIRAHRDWIPDDLSFRSVADKRDFYRRQLAVGQPLPSGQTPRVQDMNQDGVHDYRDLMVLSELIHQLVDTDGDGVADRRQLFAEGFQTEVTGIAAGVLWHDGDVYTTIAPDVWKLRDTNADGAADERQVMASGFGLHIAYAGHDMHGLTVGPDGKIYWTVGDKGISVVSPEGREFRYPNQGGVMRCNPDGSDFEVFAHGLRNVQELAFDQYGNLFGVDNDADRPGERERFVFIVEGMDAGWRCNYQYRGDGYNPWTAERLWQTWHEDQPAWVTPPIQYSLNGPAGFAFNPGTALSPEYRDYFFLTGAPGGEQRAFQVQPDGASFAVVNEHEFGRGTPLVGINFGPDGALYGVDWGGGYPLNQSGAVWKIDVPGADQSTLRQQTAQLLAAGMKTTDMSLLLPLLGHADQRVRLEAQFELVRRRAVSQLQKKMVDTQADQLARIHAVWGLGQLARQKQVPGDVLIPLLEDADVQLQLQVLRVIGDLETFDGSLLVPLLRDEHLPIRRQAAQAIRHHYSSDVLPVLLQLIADLQPGRTYLRHAFAAALSGADVRQLQPLTAHSSASVRLLTVLALRHKAARGDIADVPALLARFLRDKDSAVAADAGLAVYEAISGSAGLEPWRDALRRLSQILDAPSEQATPLLQRALGAAFLLGDHDSAATMATFAGNQQASPELRKQALRLLQQWNQPPPLDVVDGRYRTYTDDRTIESTHRAAVVLGQLLSDPDPEMQAASLRVAAELKLSLALEQQQQMARLVLQSDLLTDLRVAALRSLASQNYPQLPSLLQQVLVLPEAALRRAGLALMSGDTPEQYRALQSVLASSDDLRERQLAIQLLGTSTSAETEKLLLAELRQLNAGKAFAGTALELLEAAAARAEDSSVLAGELKRWRDQQMTGADQDITALWSECLEGGDVQAGEVLFQTHLTAQCVRCHRVGKRGSTVGPNLQGIAATRNRRHLLRAIVAPSADIDAKYRTQLLLLISGRTVQGVLVHSDDEVTVLADHQGKEIEVSSEDIDESVEQTTSIMPEMAKTLTRREIRDLVAWLATLTKK